MIRWLTVITTACFLSVGVSLQVSASSTDEQSEVKQSLSAEGWYERMLEHAPKAMYQGIFSHQAGNQMQSVEIVHGMNNGQIWERMLHLDGPTREILRRGEELYVFTPIHPLSKFKNKVTHLLVIKL